MKPIRYLITSLSVGLFMSCGLGATPTPSIVTTPDNTTSNTDTTNVDTTNTDTLQSSATSSVNTSPIRDKGWLDNISQLPTINNPSDAKLEVFPNNFTARAGEQLETIVYLTFNTPTIVGGKSARDRYRVRSQLLTLTAQVGIANNKALPNGKMQITAPNTNGVFAFNAKLGGVNVTPLTISGEVVQFKSGVTISADNDILFPRIETNLDGLAINDLKKLFGPFDSSILKYFQYDDKGYTHFPMIIRSSVLSKYGPGTRFAAAGDTNIYGYVIRTIETRGGYTLLEVRNEVPFAIFDNMAPIDMSNLLQGLQEATNSSEIQSLSSQNITPRAITKFMFLGLECEYNNPGLVLKANLNLVNLKLILNDQGFEISGTPKLELSATMGRALNVQVKCKKPLPGVASSPIALKILGKLATFTGAAPYFEGTGSASLSNNLFASVYGTVVLGAKVSLKSGSPPTVSNASSFSGGLDQSGNFWDVTGDEGKINAKATIGSELGVKVTPAGSLQTFLLWLANAFRIAPPSASSLAELKVGFNVDLGSEFEAVSLKSAFLGPVRGPSLLNTAEIKIFAKIDGWIKDGLQNLNIQNPTIEATFIKLSAGKYDIPKAKKVDILYDDGDGNAGLSIDWDGPPVSKVQLGDKNGKSLHGQVLSSPTNGDVTYKIQECVPVKAEIGGLGTLKASIVYPDFTIKDFEIPNLPFWDGTEVEVCDPYEVTPPFLSKILEIYDKDSVFFSIKRLGKAIKPVEFSITPTQVLPWLEKVFPAPAIVKPLEDKKIEVGLYCPEAPKNYEQDLQIKRVGSTTDKGKIVNIKLGCYQDDYDATTPAPMVGAVSTPVSTNFDVTYLGNNNVTTIKQMDLTIKDIGTHPDWTLSINPSSPTLLKPGDVQKIQLSTVCPSTPRRETTILEIENIRTKYKKLVTVELVCDDGPVLEVTQPADMSTYVNATTSSSFDVKNLGIGTLNYTISDPTDPVHFAIIPQSGTVAGRSSNKITVIGTCGTTPAVYPAEATVRDTVLGKTIKVNFKLECIKPVVSTPIGSISFHHSTYTLQSCPARGPDAKSPLSWSHFASYGASFYDYGINGQVYGNILLYTDPFYVSPNRVCDDTTNLYDSAFSAAAAAWGDSHKRDVLNLALAIGSSTFVNDYSSPSDIYIVFHPSDFTSTVYVVK